MIPWISCLVARRRLPDYLAGTLDPAVRRRTDQHLAACARCAPLADRHRSIIGLLGEAARGGLPAQLEARLAALPQRVIATARERGNARPGVSPVPMPLWSRPVPAAAVVAAGVLVAAGILAISISGWPAGEHGDGAPALVASIPAGDTISIDDDGGSSDGVRSTQEIPVVVYEDLVGGRRARIPAVTYVMEPAPRQQGVIRASY